jgi:NurA domain
MPWRDASVPVALVQAGLFENPHQPPAPYVKDVAVELLGPEELAGVESDTMDARSHDLLGYSEQMVHLRRFELEAETLIARMEHHAQPAGATGEKPATVAFFDGSLIVSFALKMPAYYRDRYMTAVRRLQATSAASRVPLIGYIDTSYARDVVTLLRALPSESTEMPLPEPRGVYDALLWQRELAWGDRSPAFLVARGDLPTTNADDALGGVAFVYFRAAADRPPARVEFPRWVLDAGWLDAVMDVVRTEVIAANGYPYCIEAADAVAVISMPDRARFYALFQEYAVRAGFSLSFSRKATSKHRRRA